MSDREKHICSAWDMRSQSCTIKDESFPNCDKCNFYKDKEEASIDRKLSALRLRSLPYQVRQSIYESYYQAMNEFDKRKFYVKLWWNEDGKKNTNRR